MRLTIIHTETVFFAGAQRMLGYFIETAARRWQVTVALAPNPRMAALIPPSVQVIHLPSNQEFSSVGLARQILNVIAQGEGYPHVVHGWTARDWELTAAVSKFTGAAGVGSLHDHPQAAFISAGRQKLMRGTSLIGLDRVICVSSAVRQACLHAGYDPARLTVIRNGLPLVPPVTSRIVNSPLRLGFIGAFSERKGLRGLFSMLDQLAEISTTPWELYVAGGAQDVAGECLLADLRSQYERKPWWPRVKWLGWVANPLDFFATIDLLICPSSEFDPFPTVLLEAGLAGVPALATDVGGVAEIVADEETGWVIKPAAWSAGANCLAQALRQSPDALRRMGQCARLSMESHFTVERMADEYAALYDSL